MKAGLYRTLEEVCMWPCSSASDDDADWVDIGSFVLFLGRTRKYDSSGMILEFEVVIVDGAMGEVSCGRDKADSWERSRFERVEL